VTDSNLTLLSFLQHLMTGIEFGLGSVYCGFQSSDDLFGVGSIENCSTSNDHVAS